MHIFTQLCVLFLRFKTIFVTESLWKLALPSNWSWYAGIFIVSVILLGEASSFVTELLARCHVISIFPFTVKKARNSHASTLSTLIPLFEQAGSGKACSTCVLRETVCDMIPIFVKLLGIRHFLWTFTHVFVGHMVHWSFGIITLCLVVAKCVNCFVWEWVVCLSVSIRNSVRNIIFIFSIIHLIPSVFIKMVWMLLGLWSLFLQLTSEFSLALIKYLNFNWRHYTLVLVAHFHKERI